MKILGDLQIKMLSSLRNELLPNEVWVYGTNHEEGKNLFVVAYLAVFWVPQNTAWNNGMA